MRALCGVRGLGHVIGLNDGRDGDGRPCLGRAQAVIED